MNQITRIFEKGIKPLIDNFPNKSRRALYTAGLSGAGKSSLLSQKEQQDYFVLDPDRFREMLPQYKILSKTNPTKASELTQKDAGMLFALARNECLKQGADVIIDGTFSTKQNVEIEINKAKANNYQIEVRALCVSEYEAAEGAISRYLNSVEQNISPRYVDIKYIEERYKTIPEAMSYLNEQNIDKFTILDRNQNILKYQNQEISDQTIKQLFEKANQKYIQTTQTNIFTQILKEKKQIALKHPKIAKNLFYMKEKLSFQQKQLKNKKGQTMNELQTLQEKFKKLNIKIASIDFSDEGFILTTNKGKITSENYPEIQNLTQREIITLKQQFEIQNEVIDKAQHTKSKTTDTINNFIAEIIKLQQKRNTTMSNILRIIQKIQDPEIQKLLLKELNQHSENKELKEALKNSYVDNLTNCFNTTYYHQYISENNLQWNRAEDVKKFNIFLKMLNSQKADAVMFIDLNNFKLVNDILGHDAGDEILKTFGRFLQMQNIPAIRRGGDEFILISNKDKLKQIAKEIESEDFIQSLNINIDSKKVNYSKQIQATVSYGIEDVKLPENTKSIVDILIIKQILTKAINSAEEKMYQYKKEYKEANKKNYTFQPVKTIKEVKKREIKEKNYANIEQLEE